MDMGTADDMSSVFVPMRLAMKLRLVKFMVGVAIPDDWPTI